MRKAEDYELEYVQINPLNCLQVRPDKYQLLVHSVDNARYDQRCPMYQYTYT